MAVAAPSVVVQSAEEAGPAAITAAALSAGDVPETLPDTAFACVGDIIDVSMQDGFLRCGDWQYLLHLDFEAKRCRAAYVPANSDADCVIQGPWHSGR